MKRMLLSVIVIILTAPTVSGFDGSRKGFVLGGSAGPSYAAFDHRSCACERAKSIGLQTALIVGKGISEQLTLSYTGLQFWGLDWTPTHGKVAYVLLPSVEIRYFQSSVAPSIFYTFGIGFSVYDDTLGDFDVADGLTPHLGIGYEYSSHYSIEAKLAYAIEPAGSHESLINATLLFTALAY